MGYDLFGVVSIMLSIIQLIVLFSRSTKRRRKGISISLKARVSVTKKDAQTPKRKR